jgi:hypothetical protein
LGFQVADYSYPTGSSELGKVGFKFGPEIGIIQTVDGFVESLGRGNGHAAVPGSQMGMVINPVKQIFDTIILAADSKKSAHF